MQPKVLFNHHPRYTLGPFGLFKPGDQFTLTDETHPTRAKIPGGEVKVVVLVIDWDGAGVAFDVEFLKAKVRERMAEYGKDEETARKEVGRAYKRSCSAPHPRQWHVDHERIQREMDAQCEANRAVMAA